MARISLLPLGVGLELAALLGQQAWLSWLAALAFAAYFLLHFRRLNPYPRWLGIITLGVLLGAWLSGRTEASLWPRLASSAAFYTSFLGALGLMQLLAQRLPQLRELHKALLSGSKVVLYPRYVLTAGSIGSILNFGMMNLLCGTLTEHLKRYPLSDEQRRAGLRSVMVTTLRGSPWCPCWHDQRDHCNHHSRDAGTVLERVAALWRDRSTDDDRGRLAARDPGTAGAARQYR